MHCAPSLRRGAGSLSADRNIGRDYSLYCLRGRSSTGWVTSGFSPARSATQRYGRSVCRTGAMTACLLTRRSAENRMTSKAGTQIDVIALDGRGPCSFPSAPAGQRPGQGETPSRFAPPEPGTMVPGDLDAAAVPAGDGQVRQDRGAIARTRGLAVAGQDSDAAFSRAGVSDAMAGRRTTRASRVRPPQEFIR